MSNKLTEQLQTPELEDKPFKKVINDIHQDVNKETISELKNVRNQLLVKLV